MIKSLIEYTPLLLFVIVTRFYGLPAATATLIVCSVLQYIIYRLAGWKQSSMQRWSQFTVLVLGTLSLLLHNTMIIKLKPSVLFTLFPLIGLIVYKWKHVNWLERMYREAMGHGDTPLPDPDHPFWKRALWQATAFFLAMAVINVFVALYATDQQWATFKLVGLTSLTLLFFTSQGLCLMRFNESSPANATPPQQHD